MKPKRERTSDNLETAFRDLSPWLERRLTARGTARADAEDIVQESFVRLARYQGSEQARHPRALLLRIASNLTIDAARWKQARGGDRFVDVSAIEKLADRSADPAFLLDVKRVVMTLPPKLRDTLLLARFTPMTNDEIAAHLGISTKTVEWRINRAVAICLAQLEH